MASVHIDPNSKEGSSIEVIAHDLRISFNVGVANTVISNDGCARFAGKFFRDGGLENSDMGGDRCSIWMIDGNICPHSRFYNR